jgi:hypothetical protein
MRGDPEENRDERARPDPRSGHAGGRETTLVTKKLCREAAYLNLGLQPAAADEIKSRRG